MAVVLHTVDGNVHVEWYKTFSASATIRFYAESDLTTPEPGHPAGQPKTPRTMSTNVAGNEIGQIDFYFDRSAYPWDPNERYCAMIYNSNNSSTAPHVAASNLAYL